MQPNTSTESTTTQDTPIAPPQPVISSSQDSSPKAKFPKTKKQKIGLGVALACVAAAGVITAFIIINNQSNNKVVNNTETEAHNVSTLPALENKLQLTGNSLSNFDLAFLQEENKAENLIYSPLSIKYALAMLADAANGTSKDQITALIGDYKPVSYLNSKNRSLANALFVKESFKDQVKASYADTIKQKYNASVIYDPLQNANAINNWVSQETLGIINELVDNKAASAITFMLTNALAIDMNWVNRLQCAVTDNNDQLPCIQYDVDYNHEDYGASIKSIGDNQYSSLTFNNIENTKAVQIGASINNYDIIKELGEEKIRSTVQAAYENWLKSGRAQYVSNVEYDVTKFMDKYMAELKENYGRVDVSTDFYMYEDNDVKAFAKDLQEYDGSTLQYVGIMPKTQELNSYIANVDADKITNLIKNLKEIKSDNFKQGVITEIIGKIPLFNFNYELNLTKDLQNLGITDVFEKGKANLTNLLEDEAAKESFINGTIHKADIDFSNDGIKAAAVTAAYGLGGGNDGFIYYWNVPVETIDLTFDKPFLFLIRDKSTGEVWFAGTTYKASINDKEPADYYYSATGKLSQHNS